MTANRSIAYLNFFLATASVLSVFAGISHYVVAAAVSVAGKSLGCTVLERNRVGSPTAASTLYDLTVSGIHPSVTTVIVVIRPLNDYISRLKIVYAEIAALTYFSPA